MRRVTVVLAVLIPATFSSLTAHASRVAVLPASGIGVHGDHLLAA